MLPLATFLNRDSFSHLTWPDSVAHSFHSSLDFDRYLAAFETGGHPVTDSFHFSVSDMDHNRLDNQKFTITITPDKDPPPVIAFADLITVSSPDQWTVGAVESWNLRQCEWRIST